MQDEKPGPDVRWDVGQRERAELRERLDDATHYMGDLPASATAGEGNDLPAAGPETGSIYILVPPGAPRLPWQDSRAYTGECPVRVDHLGADRCEDTRCTFLSATFPADTRPDLLHQALYLDLLAARPDLPRHLLWNWVERWDVICVHLSEVRVADMTGKDAERFVPGGEPALRRSHENWGYVRWAQAEQRAALVKLESDPAGERVAHRMLFYSHAADSLESFGAIRLTPVPVKARWLPKFDARAADGRRVVPRMLKRPAGRQSRAERYYDRLVRARATARDQKSVRRDRRQNMRRMVCAFLDNELCLDPRNPENRDPAVRAEARTLFINTVKSILPGRKFMTTITAIALFLAGIVTSLPERFWHLFF